MVDLSELERFVGKPIRIWLEDVSGEERTKPKEYTLDHVEKTEDGYVKFYVNSTQFVAVPLRDDGEHCGLFSGQAPYFMSRDPAAQLVYWIYLGDDNRKYHLELK